MFHSAQSLFVSAISYFAASTLPIWALYRKRMTFELILFICVFVISAANGLMFYAHPGVVRHADNAVVCLLLSFVVVSERSYACLIAPILTLSFYMIAATSGLPADLCGVLTKTALLCISGLIYIFPRRRLPHIDANETAAIIAWLVSYAIYVSLPRVTLVEAFYRVVTAGAFAAVKGVREK